jgi:hypothetical protein
MARPKYPSDEARKQRPHVKVHLSCRSHPRYGEVFEDPEARGIVCGLWLLAVQYHAAQTGDEVALGLGDLVWLTGRAQRAHALGALRAVCERMEYAVRDEGKRVLVRVRNLQRKQGFTPRATAEPPQPDYASEEPKNQGTEEPTLRGPAPPAARSRGSASKTPVEPSEPRAPEAASGAMRTDPAAWARMFESAPDPPPEGVESWIASVLPVIEGEADAAFASGPPSAKAWNGKVRALLWRYWRHRSRDAPGAARSNGFRRTGIDVVEDTRLELERRRRETAARIAREGRGGPPPAGGGIPAMVPRLAAHGRGDD